MVTLSDATRDVARVLAPVVPSVEPDAPRQYDIDVDQVYRVAAVNHVGLQFASLVEADSEQMAEVVTRKRRQLRTAASTFADVEQRAREDGVEIVSIKSFLEYEYVDDDLDCVVGTGTIEDCRPVLEAAGFSEVGRRVREPRKTKFVRDTDDLQIHLHETVSWNRVEYIGAADLAARARTLDVMGASVSVPHPVDEAAIHVLHSVFENKCITFSEVLQILLLREHYGVQWDTIRHRVEQVAVGSCYAAFLRRFNWILHEFFKSDIADDRYRVDTPADSILPTFLDLGQFTKIALAKVARDFRRMDLYGLVDDCYAYPLDVLLYHKLRRQTRGRLVHS